MRKKYSYELLRDKTGAALLTVITVFLVLVVLIASVTMVAAANFSRAKESSTHASAYYVAETGINEYYTLFQEYFEENSNNNSFDDSFVNDFFNEISADANGIKEFDYDVVMKQRARAEVTLKYNGSVDDVYNMEIISTGYLGTEVRSVTFSLNINNESISVGYQPDSILALEFPPYENGQGPSTLKFPPYQKMKGPMVTNKPADAGTVTFTGPLVTNNKLVFSNSYDSNWSNGLVISSNEINISQDQTYRIKAIVLKPGGTLKFNTSSVFSSNVEYLLLPQNAKANPNLYIKTNTSIDFNKCNIDYACPNIFFYDPVNFDPFNFEEYEAHSSNIDKNFTPKVIFGNKPDKELGVKGIYYDDYFKDDFVLDNDDNGNAQDYIPQVVLPKRPVYRTEHVSGAIYQEEFHGNSNFRLVDSNNNLTYELSAFNNGHKILKLGANPDEFSGVKSSERHYNSFTINGSNDNTDPLVIDVGDRDVKIVTKKLKWEGNVRVVGTGTLSISIIGNNEILNPSDIMFNFKSITLKDTLDGPDNHESSKFQIIAYETSSPVTIKTQVGSNFEFNGIIFSENLNIESQLNYYGSFISAKGKNVHFSDAGTGIKADLIFAPKAKIHLGGSLFEGVMVGREYEYSGNISISFNSKFDKALSDALDRIITIGGEAGGGTSNGTLSREPVREVSP